jgi:hypothetical protein
MGAVARLIERRQFGASWCRMVLHHDLARELEGV